MQDNDREQVAMFIEGHWFGRDVIAHGQRFFPHEEEGFIERRDNKIVGLLTFRVNGHGMEILTVNSTLEGMGIGTSLMLSAIDEARKRGCDKVSLATTNDNIKGLRFYQRIGFRITKVNVGGIDTARKLKPNIPKKGDDEIAIHDEIIMELPLKPYLDPPEA